VELLLGAGLRFIKPFLDGQEILLAMRSDTGVAEIVSDKTRCKLSSYEKNRVSYRHDMTPKNTAQIAKWISSFPGSATCYNEYSTKRRRFSK
jgi:hypothetical protein